MFLSATVLEAIVFLNVIASGYCYNLDTQFPVIFSGGKGSFFGYTTALLVNKWGPIALVGAPKSNTTQFKQFVYQPGTLFGCNLTWSDAEDPCQEIHLMTEGAVERIRNGEFAYTGMKDSMWLGVSLDVRPSQTENDIVVCGHLWRNTYFYKRHLPNGVCYVINDKLEKNSIKKLLPLTRANEQYYQRTEYNHALGQAGLSAVFTGDGSHLILGAPGIWSWTGSIVDYSIISRSVYGNPFIPSPRRSEISFGAYFGYSVTSGNFFKSKTRTWYAIGSPRDGENFGMIFIIRLTENGEMRIRGRRKGFQLGEYFGASILGIDLNGDSDTDLLVGAPLNSLLESGGDEGKVYVYMSNGKDLEAPIKLSGDNIAFARFGTALGNIGDVNQDGFNDFAVGAPYEGQGAIYIYHGYRSGFKSQYAQKIEAATINRNLAGFGIHISRGLDIDNNMYPDILVGSYSSSNAVLFRSRPVIYVSPEILFIPKQISMDQTLCTFGNQNLTCVQVETCLRYTGKHVPNKLGFKFLVEVEDSRGFFYTQSRQSSRSRQEEILDISTKLCASFHLYLSPNIKDFLTPIPVNFYNSLIPPKGSDKNFVQTFPMYHPFSLTDITSEIPFQTGCGEDEECSSDLIVSATITEPREARKLTLGRVFRFSMTATVKNEAEPAHRSELLIFLPPELPIINQNLCESAHQHNASLICSLENPLKNGSQVDIHIEVDATKIPPLTKYLEIIFQAVTTSNDRNPEDNKEILPFHLETVTDIGLKGLSSPEQVYHEEKSTSPVITHTFTVRNHGPSPLQTIDILLLIPYAFEKEDGLKQFLISACLEADDGQAIPAVCKDARSIIKDSEQCAERAKSEKDHAIVPDSESMSAILPPENYVATPKDDSQQSDVRPTSLEIDAGKSKNVTDASKLKGSFLVDCDNKDIKCIELHCSAAPFTDRRKFARIALEFELDLMILDDELKKWYQIEYVISGFISIPAASVTQLYHYNNTAYAKTVILRQGRPPQPKQVEPWIIFVSVGVGVLLLLIILITLIKLGFFKRKEKDRMKEMLYDAKKEVQNVAEDADDIEVLDEGRT